MAPQQHAIETPRHHVTTTPTMLRELRQSVRRIGKEAATYRFAREEKDGLIEVIYQQSRVGIKASAVSRCTSTRREGPGPRRH